MHGFAIPCERHELANGLRVVLSQDLHAPVVAVNLWYGVGSRHEPEGRTGFAHLFEHLMFQGSAHVPKNGYFEQIERVGGSCNATTWFDRTNYYAVVPPEHLELALWLESDRMGWMLPGMDQAKLDNQRAVVINEKREHYDNQPYGDWVERLLPLVYPDGHPYAHPVIGYVEDIESATLADVREFFATHYRPGNAVLTVAGHFDPSHALEAIAKYFGAIDAWAAGTAQSHSGRLSRTNVFPGREPSVAPGGESSGAELPTVPAAESSGTRSSTRSTPASGIPPSGSNPKERPPGRAGGLTELAGGPTREEVEAAVPLPRVFLAARTPPVSDADFATVEIAAAILGTGRAARVHRRLVRERRVASNATVNIIPLQIDAALLIASATGVGRVELAQLEEALSEEIGRLALVEDSEVERALAMCEFALLRAVERVQTRADLLSMFELYFGDPARINRELERLRAVDAERVREFAHNVLTESNRAILAYRPEGRPSTRRSG